MQPPTPREWIENEDAACREQRVERLSWMVSKTPSAEWWLISGGWLNKGLFEDARYSFVYGQFLATSVLGYAFVERSIASLLYGAGRDDIERVSGERLFREGLASGLLSQEEAAAFDHVRKLRNPLIHFRPPLHKDLPETRAFMGDSSPYDILERDAKLILEAMFRIIAKQSVR